MTDSDSFHAHWAVSGAEEGGENTRFGEHVLSTGLLLHGCITSPFSHPISLFFKSILFPYIYFLRALQSHCSGACTAMASAATPGNEAPACNV